MCFTIFTAECGYPQNSLDKLEVAKVSKAKGFDQSLYVLTVKNALFIS